MKFGKIIAVVLVIAAFAVGLLLGQGQSPAPVITAGGAGAAYEAPVGQDSEAAAEHQLEMTGASKSVAGPPQSEVVVTVNDGESIQEAVQAAAPGTTTTAGARWTTCGRPWTTPPDWSATARGAWPWRASPSAPSWA